MKRSLLRGLLAVPITLGFCACGAEETQTARIQPVPRVHTPAAPVEPGEPAGDERSAVGVEPESVQVQVQDARPHHLLPSDAVLYVEFASFEEAGELLAQASDSLERSGLPVTDMGGALSMLAVFGVDATQLRLDLPVGFAASLPDPEGGLSPTYILPVRDPNTFANALSNHPSLGPVTQMGTYVAVPLHEGYDTNFEHANAFVSDMPEGVVTCRVAVGRMIDQVAPMVRMALAQARVQAVAAEPGSDAFVAAWIQAVEEVLMALDDVDLVIEDHGSQMSFEVTLHIDEGTALGAMTTTPARDLREFLPYVDEDDQVTLLASCDPTLAAGPFEPILDALAEAFGLDPAEELLTGDGFSAGFVAHMRPGETDLALFGRGVDGAPIERGLKQGLSDLANGQNEVVAQDPVQAENEGNRFLQTDLLPLAADNTELASQVLESIFGAPRARLRMLSSGQDEWMISLGEGRSLRRKHERAPDLSPELDRALTRCEGAAAALIHRADYGWLPSGVTELLRSHTTSPTAGLEAVMENAGHTSVWVTSWWAADQGRWTFGAEFEAEGTFDRLVDRCLRARSAATSNR